jgi:hypothetical protein
MEGACMSEVTYSDAETTRGSDEEIDVENPPLVITFTPEQQAELKGTVLENSRGLSLVQKDGQLIAEQLA